MIKSRDLHYVPPGTIKCACGANLVWYRHKCTECISKEVKVLIKRHKRKQLTPIQLINHETIALVHYN